MAKANRERFPRANFFDGQRITEADLDSEQIHYRGLISDSTGDFHGSGVVRDRLFESRVLLDTSNPGVHTAAGEENASEFAINSGTYDGKAIYLDRQPSDTVYGNRLEIEASGLDLGGRVSAKVLIIGAAYSSLSEAGEIVAEIVEFNKNETNITENYYIKVVSIFFNNFSGGTGRTHNELSVKSENTLDSSGKFLIRESEPFLVFPRTSSVYQIESPNVGLANFITSGTDKTIEDEIKSGLGSVYNFNDLYFELEAQSEIKFSKDGDQTTAYGQKFLAKTDNIQKIDLLFSVEKDEAAAIGSEYDFSGDIVISLHTLSTDIQCVTDPHPDNLIDFDPDPSPIIEMSYSQEDLEVLGYKFDGAPQIVSFDFSGTLIADPNIEPSINADEYYAFLVSRRGDNRTGTVIMQKGFTKSERKTDNGQSLNVIEKFGKQTTRFFEFDPNNLVYVDDYDSSLWFVVHSDAVEVADGIAYTDDGYPVILPKTEEYVGSTLISHFLRNISLSNVSEGTDNYVVLQRKDEFGAPGIHPRTGNFVNTRIQDAPSVSIMTTAELAKVDEDNPPILLARVRDNNVRDAQDITGSFSKPGIIGSDEIVFINPSSELLSENLINRIITPDTDCECNSRYRIIGAECKVVYAADFDDDKEITSNDIIELVNVVGNTITAETTERKILGGELSLLDFTKADLNEDGTVDGFDIELIEDAVDGYVNFTVSENFKVLTLKLENVLEKDDYPTLFDSSDSASSAATGNTVSGGDDISFTTASDTQALAIRVGDKITVPSGESDTGEYIIYSKTVDETGTGVSVAVTDSDGAAITFLGSSAFDLVIVSGTKVNTYADNINLLNVPFVAKNWSISYIGASHKEMFIDSCDLRRYVETNFIEEFEEKCVCKEETCIEEEDCTPQYKNQKVLANDLFIPKGEIYKEPGVPYHGDIEYATITIPLPPGSIDDCQIDLYTNFIKAHSTTCKTASGYPAMKYSDGTYVGCEDSGGNTDITKGRVKISQCIASLHVDALVDGYATDGYADETSLMTSSEVVSEAFTDHSYPSVLGFSQWTTDEPVGGYATITAVSGSNEPAFFALETINASERYARLEYPTATISDISDDFVIDFTAARTTWDKDDLKFGQVAFFSTLVITNLDDTKATIKLGWRQNAYEDIELFFSGIIETISTSTVISDFDHSVKAKDDLGDEIMFRFRRTNEAVFGMYFDNTLLDVSSNPTGQYVKIGTVAGTQPGSGDAKINVEIAQYDNPNVGIIYAASLYEMVLRHSFSSSSSASSASVEISRDSSSVINMITATFPFLLTQKTNIVSATLEMTAVDAISTTESFNVMPYDILNADNLGVLIDYPIEKDTSFITTFSPGAVAAGGAFSVDITSLALYYLSQTGHLPGYYKALVVEPSSTAVAEMVISPSMSFSIAYEDITTGVIFKVGASLDSSTGIVALQTKNILYDVLNAANRTVLKFGVHLKKSGFINGDVTIGIKDLARIGIGTCIDETDFEDDDICFFVAGSTATGTFVDGPFPCFFHLP